MELIQQLVSQLGVTDEQAKGGAGMVFDLAKSQLEPSEFDQVTTAIPEANDLVAAAPVAKSGVGSVSGLLSSVVGENSGLGSIASLSSGFSDLGMKPDLVSQFLPVVLSFAQAKGGDLVKGLLTRVLK